jgi:hypothetical protein
MGKRNHHYAVSLIEKDGENTFQSVVMLRICCEDEEAEEFVFIALDDVLSKWYGHFTIRDGNVFYFHNGSMSPCVQTEFYKEVTETTFSEMIQATRWFTRDIDDHRKKILCS